MANQDDLRLLIKIATLYYNERHKQAEIAKQLNISQSQVSRAINRCIKEGLVKITVAQPPNIFIAEEQELQARYKITQAIVVDVPENPTREQIKQAIGASAAYFMETTLIKDALIGVSSWSSTIRAMVDNMHPQSTKVRGVIQLLGGVGQNGNLQANMLTQALADLYGCPADLLPAINIERTVEDKQRLLASREVADVVKKFREVNLAIIGIGSTEPSTLLRNSGDFYHEEMTSILIGRGAVGDICLHYYNADGQAVLSEDEDPVISMSLEEMRLCPRVVALAGGIDKVAAIKGALNGGLMDVLITDRVTAEALLATR